MRGRDQRTRYAYFPRIVSVQSDANSVRVALRVDQELSRTALGTFDDSVHHLLGGLVGTTERDHVAHHELTNGNSFADHHAADGEARAHTAREDRVHDHEPLVSATVPTPALATVLPAMPSPSWFSKRTFVSHSPRPRTMDFSSSNRVALWKVSEAAAVSRSYYEVRSKNRVGRS